MENIMADALKRTTKICKQLTTSWMIRYIIEADDENEIRFVLAQEISWEILFQ